MRQVTVDCGHGNVRYFALPAVRSRRWRLYLIRQSNEARKLFSASEWRMIWRRVPVRRRAEVAFPVASYRAALAAHGLTEADIAAQVAEYFPEVA